MNILLKYKRKLNINKKIDGNRQQKINIYFKGIELLTLFTSLKTFVTKAVNTFSKSQKRYRRKHNEYFR